MPSAAAGAIASGAAIADIILYSRTHRTLLLERGELHLDIERLRQLSNTVLYDNG